MEPSLRSLRPTVLTATDEEEGYTSETLGEALSQDHACRHLARIAQLYFARTQRSHSDLSNQDYAHHIPHLFDKLFGKFTVSDAEETSKTLSSAGGDTLSKIKTGNGSIESSLEDFGWLHRQANAPDSPKEPIFNVLRSNLTATFDKKKYSRQQLGAFRLCQLLDAFESGNLFDFIFRDESSQRVCVYYLPDILLEEKARGILLEWFNRLNMAKRNEMVVNDKIQGPAMPLPELFLNLRFIQPDTIEVQRPGSLALDLEEFFLFRFLSWFVYVSIPPPIANIPTPTTPPSLSTAFVDSFGSTATASNKTLTSKKAPVYLQRVSIYELIVREPSLELLFRYFYYFLPHEECKDSRVAKSRSRYLFAQILIEQWLNRNSTAEQDANVVVSRGNGTLTMSSPAYPINRVSKFFLPPTFLLVKAIAILVTYLQMDPFLQKLPAKDTSYSTARSPARYAAPNELGTLGTSTNLIGFRKALYHYFHNSISNASKADSFKDAGFVRQVDLWLMFLSPWSANARTTPPKKTALATSSIRSHLSSMKTVVQEGVRDIVDHSKNTTQASGKLESRGTGSTDNKYQCFTKAWTWYFVQHYLICANILGVFLKRLQDTSINPEQLAILVQAFRRNGVFSDAIVSILRACEILIEDAVSGVERRIRDTVFESLPSLDNSSRPLYDRSELTARQGVSSTPSSLAEARAALEILEANRYDAIEILKRQFTELAWDISKTPIPSIQSLRSVAQRVLQQMHWRQREKGKSRGSQALAAGGVALQWINRTIHSTTGGEKDLSEGDMIVQAMDRMHKIFDIPDVPSLSASKMTAVDTHKRNEPDSKTVYAKPTWMEDGHECSYKRLTDLGRLQLAMGERDISALATEYIGDPLLNPPPICRYEIPALVRIFHILSLKLNSLVKLEAGTQEREDALSSELVEERFRINLRFLADKRNLIFILLITATFDLTIFRVGIIRYCLLTIIFLVGSLVLEDISRMAFNFAFIVFIAAFILATS